MSFILKVDPESNYLGADVPFDTDSILELVKTALYEIDDMNVLNIEVEEQ